MTIHEDNFGCVMLFSAEETRQLKKDLENIRCAWNKAISELDRIRYSCNEAQLDFDFEDFSSCLLTESDAETVRAFLNIFGIEIPF